MTVPLPLLAELREALAAATPGRWERVGYQVVTDGRNGMVADAETTTDAAAIVTAVNVAPALLAAIEAVQELADAWDIDAASDAIESESGSLNPDEAAQKLGHSEALTEATDALRTALAVLNPPTAPEGTKPSGITPTTEENP